MAFVAYPRLKHGVSFHVPEDPSAADVICLAGGLNFLVRRAVHDRLVPLLTGQHSLTDLARAAAGALSAAEVAAFIQWLARHGAVEDAAYEGPGRVAVEFEGLSVDKSLERALVEAGLHPSDAGDADMTIVVARHYLDDALSARNRTATKPWLLVRPDSNFWLGPLFTPGKNACWECLAQRLRFNLRIDHYLASVMGESPGSDVPGPDRAMLFAHAAQGARRFLETGDSPLINGLVALDRDGGASRRHTLVRRRQCPACGSPLKAPTSPPDLGDPEHWRERTANREAAARRTLTDFAHHLSPITGLVPELTSQSRLPGIHVYGAGPYHVKRPTDWATLDKTLRYRGAGKGLTAEIAKAGAFAETLEWYTTNAQEPSSLTTDSFNRLSRRARAIPPSALSHFSPAQYADRETINARALSNKERIPEPFDPDHPIGWVKAWSLTAKEWAFLPGAVLSNVFDTPSIRHHSNGSAAGPSLTEAVVHGALEVVERDAIALWWYNRIPRARISLEGVDRTLIETMAREYARIGRRFWVLDITSDLGIPVAAAISLGDGQTEADLVMGFGAHFDRSAAVTRALTELNQLQGKLVDTVPRDDRTGDVESRASGHPAHLDPSDDTPVRPPHVGQDTALASPSEQVAWLVEHFRGHGLEMIVADVTLPDVGLPVARVLIPGLRHCYPEFGPGRLHDTPIAEGWISAPVPEASMRELPLPL